MAKAKTVFFCTNCGNETPKWMGRCPGCGAFNTMEEHVEKPVAVGKAKAEDLTEDMLSSYLYSKEVPDPELIIRPSGELRTSNFLLWQSAYSEYVFMNVLWPDFGPEDLDEAISQYNRRNRRFGGV